MGFIKSCRARFGLQDQTKGWFAEAGGHGRTTPEKKLRERADQRQRGEQNQRFRLHGFPDAAREGQVTNALTSQQAGPGAATCENLTPRFGLQVQGASARKNWRPLTGVGLVCQREPGKPGYSATFDQLSRLELLCTRTSGNAGPVMRK